MKAYFYNMGLMLEPESEAESDALHLLHGALAVSERQRCVEIARNHDCGNDDPADSRAQCIAEAILKGDPA